MVQLLPRVNIDDIPGLVVLADADGRIQYANQQFIIETGFSEDDLSGALLTSLWTLSDDAESDLLSHISKNNRWQKEILHRRKDGSEFSELCSVSKISSDETKTAYLLKVGQMLPPKRLDTSGLLEKFKQVEEKEKSYRTVMELSPIAIALTRSSDARYIDVNQAWCDRTGLKKEDVLGKTSPELNVYRDLSVRKKLWEEFNTRGQVDDLELAFTNRFGENLYSLVSARKIQFMGEECLLYISTKIDALKAAEKKLAESEENYRTILEMAPYAIAVSKRADGTYLQVNKAFMEKSGYTAKEVLGRTPADIDLYVHPSDRDRLVKILEKEGKVDRVEIAFRGKDGKITDNIVSMSAFQYQGEDCIISMGVDVTERKAAVEELNNYRKNLENLVAERTEALKAAQKDLVKAEKLAVLGQLTATVSHELRNPLGVIRSSNFYLQRKVREKDEKVEKHFKRIDEQISHCNAIVNELLEYTQGRSAKPVVQSLTPWIPLVVEQFQEQEATQIFLEMDKDLAPIAHDQEKMQRVLINLLNNAIQAVNAKAEICIKENQVYSPVVKVQAHQHQRQFVLTVEDNGIGMDKNIRQKAFEPLFTTKARGTGIGLANVKKTVEDHGGDVELESSPGKGTRVSVVLNYI